MVEWFYANKFKFDMNDATKEFMQGCKRKKMIPYRQGWCEYMKGKASLLSPPPAA